jgi:hypothetical protein
MTGEQEQTRINPLSWQSLLIKTTQIHCFIAQATGFVVEHEEKYYLITNWHVLAHRDPLTSRYFSSEGNTPNRVHIYHHTNEDSEMWFKQGEELLDDEGKSRWLQQQRESGFADVVALPLKSTPPGCTSLKFCPVDLSTTVDDNDIDPGMLVYIIGYLEGINVGSGECLGGIPHGGWPIWITGHIACDPGLDYQGRPVYLINASTGGGLSGAPAFVRVNGTMKFLGVHSSGMVSKYSGERVNGMGEVWRAKIIKEILSSA